MQRPTRQNKMLIGKSMDVPVIPRAFAQGRKFMRLTSAVLLSLATLSVHQTASAVPVTHVFTAITYLSFFGVDGSDEFQMSYTYDTDLVAQGATAGFSRYGLITGNVRADSVTGGFDFDFNVGNTNTEILAVLDNATVLSLPDPADVFSIGFSTTEILGSVGNC